MAATSVLSPQFSVLGWPEPRYSPVCHGDYSTNLSSVRLIDDRGLFTLEHRPRTRRYEVSTLANLTRRYSLLFTVDRTQDSEVTEQRYLAGLTIRF